MRKKKLLTALITAAMTLGSITGCGNAESGVTASNSNDVKEAQTQETSTNEVASDTEAETEDKSLKIVTTIFPEYDWVKTVLGDKVSNAELTLLLDNGVDLHSYQPTAEDIVKIQECDMFVYVGGESDEWVEDVLASAENPDMSVINLLDVLGDSVKAEEIVEGMEHEHEHEEADEDEHDHEDADEDEHDHDHEDADSDEHEHEEGEEHEHEEEMDEHVWLSLRNAEVLCDSIADELGKIDPANADTYKKNAQAYKDELAALDKEYEAAVAAADKKTLLFGDRFPFRYLVDDYGLDYYAAFTGCSAESEASFETIIFLAEKVNELKLGAIMTIEGPDHDIAETVKNATESKDQKILTLNSMQSTTSHDIKAGVTYLSIMEKNLEVLKEALQ